VYQQSRPPATALLEGARADEVAPEHRHANE